MYRALRSYSYGSHGVQTTDDGYDHRQGATSTQSRVIWCCSCTTLRVFLGPTPDINHTLGVPCVYGCTSDATTNPPRAQKLRSRTINGYRYDRGRVWRLSLCPYRAAATPSPSLRMRWRLIATGASLPARFVSVAAQSSVLLPSSMAKRTRLGAGLRGGSCVNRRLSLPPTAPLFRHPFKGRGLCLANRSGTVACLANCSGTVACLANRSIGDGCIMCIPTL